MTYKKYFNLNLKIPRKLSKSNRPTGKPVSIIYNLKKKKTTTIFKPIIYIHIININEL